MNNLSNEMIFLQPIGGLCNRMRAIASAITLSKLLKKKLIVFWEANKDCNSSFLELFYPLENIYLIDINLKDCIKYFFNTNNFYKIKKRSKLFKTFIDVIMTKKFDFVLWPEQFVNLEETKFDFSLLGKYKKIFISSHSPFLLRDKIFNKFLVREDLENRIEEISRYFDSHTIGVHIRRKDHSGAMANSPLKSFIASMQNYLDINEKANFFLATDCPKTEKIICKIFMEKVMVQKKEFSRHTTNGIKHAVIDLYCLSRTKKIFGSYHSSFSHTAASLSGIKIITIKKNETINF